LRQAAAAAKISGLSGWPLIPSVSLFVPGLREETIRRNNCCAAAFWLALGIAEIRRPMRAPASRNVESEGVWQSTT